MQFDTIRLLWLTPVELGRELDVCLDLFLWIFVNFILQRNAKLELAFRFCFVLILYVRVYLAFEKWLTIGVCKVHLDAIVSCKTTRNSLVILRDDLTQHV